MDAFADRALTCSRRGDRAKRSNCLHNQARHEAPAAGFAPARTGGGCDDVDAAVEARGFVEGFRRFFGCFQWFSGVFGCFWRSSEVPGG